MSAGIADLPSADGQDQDARTAPGVLSGVRVTDFTRGLAGPYATQVLGDLGADVIKVEPPRGDEQRADRGASKVGEAPAGFIAYNRNKRSIVLDLKSEAGLEVARRLTRTTDVVVQNFRTGVVDKFGLDYESVRQSNPSVVYCSISGFGSTGPRAKKAANDIVIQAASGLMSITGNPGEPPVRAHGYPADLTTGIWAALGVLAALYHRHETGEGQLVEVSMLGTVMASLGRVFGEFLVDGHVPAALGSGTDMGAPNGAFPTSDGWVTIAALNNERWARVCRALGLEDLLDDPRFATREDRRRRAAEVVAAVSAATARLTREEAERRLEAQGNSCSPIRTIPEVASDPDSQRNFVRVPVRGNGEAYTVGSPLRFAGTPVRVRRGVPQLGQDEEEILYSLGYDRAQVERLRPGLRGAGNEHESEPRS